MLEPQAQHLQVRVPWPRVYRPPEQLLVDVDEAQLDHPLLALLCVGPRPPGTRCSVLDMAISLLQCCAVHAFVDAAHRKVRILHLEVAASRKVRKSLGEHSPGVFEAGDQEPAMDEVKTFCVGPLVLKVLNFKTALGQYEFRLDGGEI